MRKLLYFMGLGVFVFSCATKKPVYKQTVKAKPTVRTLTSTENSKPQIQKLQNVEFYTTNIADATKNDNTISYGSIVTAKPAGYKVVKTYFPAVAQNFRQKYLILHYTALDDDKSITVLSQQAVSAHYLVNNIGNNEIYQLVDENKRAYHAGISHWRKDDMLNDTSIGIEIVNDGYKVDATNMKVFAPFNEAQIKKVAALVKDIATRYMISPTNILAHSDIAPTRKQDPGPTFPWKKLYDEYQIGMWYDDATKQNFIIKSNPEDFATQMTTSTFVFKVQTALQQFGYGVVPSGILDDSSKKTIEAFQYHFRPQKCDGIMDVETFAILQALNVKYPN